MTEKLVRYRAEDRPPLSADDIESLKALMARPDHEIDLSDIPELTVEQLDRAVRGRHYRTPKS